MTHPRRGSYRAPDESFIVFRTKHPATEQHERLVIAFRTKSGWGRPIDLGDDITAQEETTVTKVDSPLTARTLYSQATASSRCSYPRTRAQAEADLATHHRVGQRQSEHLARFA